jgi:hypothetical protein
MEVPLPFPKRRRLHLSPPGTGGTPPSRHLARELAERLAGDQLLLPRVGQIFPSGKRVILAQNVIKVRKLW